MKYWIQDAFKGPGSSLPARGAWIEIFMPDSKSFLAFAGRSPHGEHGLKSLCRGRCAAQVCRSPHGEHGLKSKINSISVTIPESLPARGAWIEISPCTPTLAGRRGRSPHGEHGLKFRKPPMGECPPRRSPHGEHGLKYCTGQGGQAHAESLPARGAWIEITHPRLHSRQMGGRSPHGECGSKYVRYGLPALAVKSWMKPSVIQLRYY